jgi:hypothetical protein
MPNAVALSASLPLQTEPFDDRKTRPFFSGLLPEGQMRRLIAQQFQVSGQNDFALLDHIGGECAGAVTFLEPGQAIAGACPRWRRCSMAERRGGRCHPGGIAASPHAGGP